MLYFILQIGGVQNFIATKIKNKLEPSLGISIQFDKVSLDMLNRIVVDNLIVLDQRKDTIVEANSIIFGLKNFSLSKRQVKIKKIELEQANVHFIIDSARHLNLEYIVNKALESSDSTKPGWLVEFDQIGFVNSRLRIEDAIKNTPNQFGVNFSNMILNRLNIRVRDLTVWDGLCTFKINRLSFVEQSGFDLEQLTGRMSIRKNMMHLNNVHIATSNSSINAPRLYFDFNRFGNFSEFDKKVNLQFWIHESNVSVKDIAYFLIDANGMEQRFSLSGRFKGKFSNLDCAELKLNTGKNSRIDGDIHLIGLPDFKKVNIALEATELFISVQDLEAIKMPFLNDKHLVLPEIAKNLQFVNFNGSFNGYPQDFVTKGTFKTGIGNFITNVNLKSQSKETISINGKINAGDFKIGKLLNKEGFLGLTDIDLNANVIIEDGKKVSGTFNSKLTNCDVNKYFYKEIQVNGSLKNNAFDGSVKIDDPNIALSAAGYVDFSRANTVFNFSSTIYHADPFALNFSKDSINFLSGQLMANFKGHNIDSIDGEIGLANLIFKRNKQSLSIKNIFIKSENSGLSRGINLRSDMVVATVKGERDLSVLPASLIQFVRHYMPETFKSYAIPLDKDYNRFTFDIVFKNTKDVCAFFFPGSTIAPNTNFKGSYDPGIHLFKMDLVSDSLQYSKYKFTDLALTAESNWDSLWADIQSKQMLVAGQISLLDVKTHLLSRSDSSIVSAFWQDSLKHESQLHMLSRVAHTVQSKPVQIFEVYPSKIYLLNELWTINSSSFLVDSTSIFVPQFVMYNNQQKVVAGGTISESPADEFYAEFSNFNLSIANFLLNFPKLKLDGKMSGKLSISDFYNSREILTNVDISDFKVNKELLGQTSIKTKIDQLSKKLNIQAHAETKDNHFLNLSGDYVPQGELLDFKFTASNTGAQVFEPFVESIFDIERGRFTGFGELGGTLSYPVLNAQMDVDSGSFMIKVLKTSYAFSTKLRIINNKFLLKNIRLIDADKNVCKVDGYIDNEYFKTFQLYITLMLEKNLVLDLKPKDEMPFYGKGYASGIVRITGKPEQVNIDIISAKTEKNTVIYIPLNQENIVSQDFIKFADKATKSGKSLKTKQVYEVKSSGLTLNIDLEMSPDAEVQLVFDPALGDIMRAQGSGNLKLELNKSGNFTIRGNYVVRSGDYMFTLKNLLNKQFIIDQGGTIMFNGSPMDATLDIAALYKTRASLYNLFYEEDFKKRIPINCQLFVTGKLLNPDIRYDISLPNAADETRNKVKEAINNEQELSKQFMSLLVLNNFLPDLNKATTYGIQQNNASIIGRDAAATTSLELLSSQVSNWVSQISKDFDVGVNYRPGDKNFTNQEFEVALSTQLLDDRVSINGNLDFIGSQANATTATKQNTSNLVGDVNVEFKLTDKVLLKAFNRSNDQLFDYNDLYTRGVGVAYREEFRNFNELGQRYYDLFFVPKKVQAVDSVKSK